MNNCKGNKTNNSIIEKSQLLSGQVITLDYVKELVKETNSCQELYDKTREKRNMAIKMYVEQQNKPDTVYQLAYEIKISPATIYKIIKQII